MSCRCLCSRMRPGTLSTTRMIEEHMSESVVSLGCPHTLIGALKAQTMGSEEFTSMPPSLGTCLFMALGTQPITTRPECRFTKQMTNEVFHVDFIKQDAPHAEETWSTFILDKSQGFTRSGIERLNDSIRTYMWVILGVQAQTRTCILGQGMAFDVQKQFLVNVEDAI